MLFAIGQECWGCSDVFLCACPVHPTNAQLGTNLDCTVASRVVQCCCLPESLDKLWLHEDGHYHAGKSFDAVALTELRQDEGSHLCILPLLGSREQQSMATSYHGKSHTITDTPPYLSLSKTQGSANRSPRRRYRRCSPSARKRVNWDSSVKKTRLHCLIGKCLGACAVTQAIRHARRAQLSRKPSLGRWACRPNSRNRFLTVFWDEYGDYDCLPYLPRFPWPWGDDYADEQDKWLCFGAAMSRADVQIGVGLRPVQFPSDVEQNVLWWKHAHRNA